MSLEDIRSILWIFAPTCAVLGIISGALIPFIDHRIETRNALEAIPSIPEVYLSTSTEGLKLWAQPEITSEKVSQQRMQKLEIRNNSKVSITHFELRLQFPEPIIKLQSDAKPEMCFSEEVVWDNPNVNIAGDMPNVKGFGDITTGLRKLSIGHIPGETSVRIEMLTSLDSSGELYFRATRDHGLDKSDRPPYLWFLDGSFKYEKGRITGTKKFYLPLIYDAEKRMVSSLSAREGEMSQSEWVQISMMPGVDTGTMQTRGMIHIGHPGQFFANPNIKPTISIELQGKGHTSVRSSKEHEEK